MTVRTLALLVTSLNLAYFVIEFAVAARIGSVALFADSMDFLEDASLNLLVAFALGWHPAWRARLGLLLAVLLLAPALATLWAVWRSVHTGLMPAPTPLTLTGAGALVVNLTCALLLARRRREGGSLTRAAFLSARNDVLASLAITLAGLATAGVQRGWPDLLVGLGIALLNVDAARAVWRAARGELQVATPRR